MQLTVDLDAGEVHLVVVDRGRPGVAPGSSEHHFGLVGMRERARAIGGDLEAGPTADGWRVEARLPAGVGEHRASGPGPS